jgi:NAD dependent epimerase/dehydratase family enzyme
VHQQDVIAIIRQLVVSETASDVYNVVSNTHLSKRKFYSIAANAIGATPPTFALGSTNDSGKKVLSDKIRRQLNYRFIHDDLVAWLAQHSLNSY